MRSPSSIDAARATDILPRSYVHKPAGRVSRLRASVSDDGPPREYLRKQVGTPPKREIFCADKETEGFPWP